MKKTNYLTMAAASVGLLILIFDSRTAIQGARAGVDLCIYTLIPSLFSFFIVSILLTGSMVGQELSVLRPLGKLCRIPQGSESLLAIGFLGGYPVGAQNVALAYDRGQISRQTARRMVAFCNNAGPAFLFGIVGPMFTNSATPWLLWGIHIASALLVSRILPAETDDARYTSPQPPLSMTQALEKALRVMAGVCGWVIVFRMLIEFLNRWLFWALPKEVQIIFSGLLELSNGCLMLGQIENEGLRFVIASVILALGGSCVTMQTVSASGNLPLDMYFPGKLLQGCFSFLLASAAQPLLFGSIPSDHSLIAAGCTSILFLFIAIFHRKSKKAVAI